MHNYPKKYTLQERLELYQLALDDFVRTESDGIIGYMGFCVYYAKECNVNIHIGNNVRDDPDYHMENIFPELWYVAMNDTKNLYSFDYLVSVFLTYPWDARRIQWLKDAIDIVKQKIEDEK